MAAKPTISVSVNPGRVTFRAHEEYDPLPAILELAAEMIRAQRWHVLGISAQTEHANEYGVTVYLFIA